MHPREAEQLHREIARALAEGAAAAALPLAQSLFSLEKGSVRASVALVASLQQLRRLDEADALAAAQLVVHKGAAPLLVKRAQLAAERGQHGPAEIFLSLALKQDPNHALGLALLAARSDVAGVDVDSALEGHAKASGSWRAHVLLYGRARDRGNVDAARAQARRALQKHGSAAAHVAEAMLDIDADDDVIAVFLPYHPQKHGVFVGTALVRALLRAGRRAEAFVVEQQLRAFPAAAGSEGLKAAAALLAAAAATTTTATTAAHRSVVIVPMPLSGTPPGGIALTRPQVAVSAFVDVDASDDVDVAVCRALPLALAQAFADVGAYAAFPVVRGAGFWSARAPLSLDERLHLLPASLAPRLLIGGHKAASSTGARWQLQVFDLKKRSATEVNVDAAGAPDDVFRRLLAGLAPAVAPMRPTAHAIPLAVLAAALPVLVADGAPDVVDSGALVDNANVVVRAALADPQLGELAHRVIEELGRRFPDAAASLRDRLR